MPSKKYPVHYYKFDVLHNNRKSMKNGRLLLSIFMTVLVQNAYAMEGQKGIYLIFEKMLVIIESTCESPTEKLKALYAINPNPPFGRKLHAIDTPVSDPQQVLDMVKRQVETQLNAPSRAAFRLQGLQAVHVLTKPFAE